MKSNQEPKTQDSKDLTLLVISSLDFGGAQKILIGLANRLVAEGYPVKIITLSGPTPPAFEVDPSIEITHLNLLSNSAGPFQSLSASLRRIWTLRKQFRSMKPKRILSFMDRVNILVLLATRGLRTRVIVSERSHPSKNSVKPGLNLMRRLLYPWANIVVFQTSGARSHFPFLAKESTTIIPNPAELISREQAEPPTRKMIVGIGRLSREKGFDLLVKAFANLAKQFPDWNLCIFGDGPERVVLETLARSLDVKLELPGWRDPSQALAMADLFVLPSRFEGFPNSLIEAMSAQVPIISSDCDFGPREILNDGEFGTLFRCDDFKDLEAKLSWAISNEQARHKMAQQGYESLQRYNPDRIFSEWKEALGLGPKRVVFLIRSLALGGAERQLINLVNHLDPKLIEPIVLTFYPGGDLESSVKSNVKLISLNKRGRWNNLAFLFKLRSQLKRLKPEVVYSFLTTSNIFASLLRSFDSSFKLVWGVRSTTMDLKRFGVIAQVEGVVEGILKKSPDLVICNADAARDYRISRGYSKSRLAVVANGIDCEQFRPNTERGDSLRQQLQLTREHFIVGMVARFDPMKGYETFLEAAARAVSMSPNLRLLVMGSGNERYEQQLNDRSLKLNLQNRLVWVKGVALQDFYNAIDVFTLSSLGEAFPNVLAEAMSCGRPCVSTDVGDAAKIVNQFGIIVPVKDAEALAKAWIQMEQRRSQWDARTISDSIRNRFGLERYAEETCQALQQLS